MGTFRMPSLGADMEAGTLVEWLKKPGDIVQRGDIIAVVETQKGAIEVEVFEAGRVEQLLLQVGATVPVGAAMAEIRSEGEPIAKPAAAPETTPAARPATEIKASPAARKFAEEHGLDLTALQGSGPDGAILFVDVETAWQRTAPAAVPAQKALPVKGIGETPAADGMRAAIAAAMTRAKRDIPHYYLGHAVDVTASIAWLAKRNADCRPEERAVFAALLIKAIALSLAKYPEFNGTFEDGRLRPSARINVGMAIALRGGGLIAPAIHNTPELSLDQLMGQLRDLTNRVRAGRFRSSELAEATITLTSLGERGVDWVQPIIYPPQVAIVGAGTPTERPWVVAGKVAVRHVCELTLAADHRASDGHRGALFLKAIGTILQTPEVL